MASTDTSVKGNLLHKLKSQKQYKKITDSIKRLDSDFFYVDLEDPSSIEKLINSVSKKYNGRLDGLVNNGAIATGIGGISFEDIDRINSHGISSVCCTCTLRCRQKNNRQ